MRIGCIKPQTKLLWNSNRQRHHLTWVGRQSRSNTAALPYARLPPAINSNAFAPYAALLPGVPSVGSASLMELYATHRTLENLQQQHHQQHVVRIPILTPVWNEYTRLRWSSLVR